MGIYDRDWLSFYDEDKIRERQKRWEEEKESVTEKEDPGRLIASGGEPYVRQTYTGRNDPCLCGSGKKYKMLSGEMNTAAGFLWAGYGAGADLLFQVADRSFMLSFLLSFLLLRYGAGKIIIGMFTAGNAHKEVSHGENEFSSPAF